MIKTENYEYIYSDGEEGTAYFLDTDTFEEISIPLKELLEWRAELPEEGETVPFWYDSSGKLHPGKPPESGVVRKLDELSTGMWIYLEGRGPYQIVSVRTVKSPQGDLLYGQLLGQLRRQGNGARSLHLLGRNFDLRQESRGVRTRCVVLKR